MYRIAPYPSREQQDEAGMFERVMDGMRVEKLNTLPLPVCRVMLENKQSVKETEETAQKEESREE